MPYKAAGYVKNASRECVINLEVKDGKAAIVVYATQPFQAARVVLTAAGEVVYDRTADLSPTQILRDGIPVAAPETELCLAVYTAGGRKLLEYQPRPKKIEEIPDPAAPAKLPEEILTNEEL